ncbi:MAG: metal ABC transporter ATP-binding protein [Pseudomonadota bacterium]|uniref:metal ABC transporter ATP-binding protein n=1 Tax=Thalassovita sp. TaxID=1979401 RepID=UPI002AB1AA48|nr:metal ABC transporter ATP-binding protein [Thalassovita sp.]MEC7961950.1 metal ABC transporter ATP-binding protein [Pseudomonadota bacterium]MEC8041365.1 metal ABC transporter ATP-binding protein [Pseudomonadota bacterium]
MDRLVEIADASVHQGATVALTGVDFHIDRGEIVTVVGPNGSGKSTLMKTVIGALKPSAGAVKRKPGLRIGYVPQKLQIDPTLPITVARFLGLPRRLPRARALEVLEQAGVPDLADRQMARLSGGQFQRVLLARAMLEEPDLLILDEATQGLDQPGSAAFYRQIEEIRQAKGCAVLMVSHELHVVMAASDRVICLNGHVCCHGAPEIVASAPEYRALFGSGTGGALALYRHDHDHSHDSEGNCLHDHDCGHHDHDHTPKADANVTSPTNPHAEAH